MLPFQASGSGSGEEPDPAFPVDYLPLLMGVVEFDVGGAVDFQRAKFVKRDCLGPKTVSCAVDGE